MENSYFAILCLKVLLLATFVAACTQDAATSHFGDVKRLESLEHRAGRSIPLVEGPRIDSQPLMLAFFEPQSLSSDLLTPNEKTNIARDVESLRRQILASTIVIKSHDARLVDYSADKSTGTITTPFFAEHTTHEYPCRTRTPSNHFVLDFEYASADTWDQIEIGKKHSVQYKAKFGKISNKFGFEERKIERRQRLVAQIPISRDVAAELDRLGESTFSGKPYYMTWHVGLTIDNPTSTHSEHCFKYEYGFVANATVKFLVLTATPRSSATEPPIPRVLWSWSSDSMNDEALRSDIADYLFLAGYCESTKHSRGDIECVESAREFLEDSGIVNNTQLIDPSTLTLLMDFVTSLNEADSRRIPESSLWRVQTGVVQGADRYLPVDLSEMNYPP